jgi:predicted CXXCH cytochrome family protein
MNNIIRLAALILCVFFFNAQPSLSEASEGTRNSCIECHRELQPEIVTAFQEDIHSKKGLSCESCHGGNPRIADELAMDKKHGFVGSPKRADVPMFCGKCHSDPAKMRSFNPSLATDQVEKYWTSVHGMLLKKGDENVATCVSCHKTHGILPANDPRSSVYARNVPATCASCHADAAKMSRYNIPTTQFEQYTDSANVHGYALFIKNDIGAPACNDCHGNHGAAPPGLTEVGQVCTQCHALNGELFRSSPHKDGFDGLGVPECAFCHQASPDIDLPKARIHTIARPSPALIGTSQGAVCIQCHSEGDEGWKTAGEISSDLDSLERRLELVEAKIEKAEQQGMEVSDARWKLKSEVLQARMELRTSVHAFSLKHFLPMLERADTSLEGVESMGNEAEVELRSRRIYFGVMTVLIGLVVVGLILKLKSIKPRQND